MALKPGFCQHRPTVVAFSPHRYCVITYIMSQPPAHYVVLVLLVQLVISLVSVSLPLSSRLCLGQRCYDSANQLESSHWFVIITPLERFGEVPVDAGQLQGTHRGWREKQETGAARMRLHLHLLHRQPHKRAESMFYTLESSLGFLMRRAKAAIIQTQRG